MTIDLRIDIDRSRTGGIYTNHGVISGTVKLTTTSSLSLSYIQVKLEGISSTQMTVPKRGLKKRNETLLLTDTHKVLYDTVMVFPPENIRQVSLAKEFTLASGTNTYPFLFKIPMKTDCLKASKGSDLVLSNRNTCDVFINYAELSLPVPLSSDSASSGRFNPMSNHINKQLPPIFQAMSNCANIMYFVKVTCKRASLFKMSVRAIDPFTFLPLDLDEHFQPIVLQEEGYRELFFRKDVVFRNRIPQIPVKVDKPSYQRLYLPACSSKKGFFSSLFSLSSPPPPPPPEKSRWTILSCSSDPAKDINFAFEIRFRHPVCLSPIGPPRFKLFFVSNVEPSTYSLAKYGRPQESNGLGTIFLQRLKIDLLAGTNITVVEKTGFPVVHQARGEEVISLCDNSYQNLPLDLMHSKIQQSLSASINGFTRSHTYELEIPKKYYENVTFPPNLTPTFQTCNIERTYLLVVAVGVSSEKLSSAMSLSSVYKRIKFVDLFCPNIRVLSGQKLPEALHSKAFNANLGSLNSNGKVHSDNYDSSPPPPRNGSLASRPNSSSPVDSPLALPIYEDLVRKSSYLGQSEHIPA